MWKRFRVWLPLFLTASLAVLIFSARRVQHPQELKFTLRGSDEDARVLVERLLQVNKPWLAPVPLQGTYSVRFTGHRYSMAGCSKTQRTLGPFTIARDSPQEIRVGALVWTPLHTMESSQPDVQGKRWFRHGDEGRPVPYTVRMLGEAVWRGIQVVGVEVTFETPERCSVGTGGQIDGTYECSTFPAKKARIVLDERNAIPLLVGVSESTNGFVWEYTWEFSPRFFRVSGGLAPQSFEWRWGKNRYRQSFQVIDSAWIFKEGRAVWDLSYPGQTTRSGTFLGNVWARLKSHSWSINRAEIFGLQALDSQSSSKQ